MYRYGKSTVRIAWVANALQKAALSGVPCQHEADFYYRCFAQDIAVKLPSVVTVPQNIRGLPCTTR